jgi:thioredoxin 1
MATTITNLTEATFNEEVNSSSVPVVVDFWAEWCRPCKMISPILEEIAESHPGQIRITKVNVDDHPGLATSYNVQSIPTLIVFKDGEEDHRVIGAKGKPQLLEDLAAYL